MPHSPFVHLRIHSAYSLSEGAITIKDLVKLCQRHAMPAVAITDTANLFGALEFALACAEAGVQPIIGCQLPVRRVVERGAGTGSGAIDDALVLLVQSEEGYRNLLDLVSAAYLETDGADAPHVTLDRLARGTGGLLALTAGPQGAIGRLLADGQDSAAEAMVSTLMELFPGRLYVEIMRHGMTEERRIEPRLLDLAYRHDLPLVATNDVFFADAPMYEAHDALLCISGKTFVNESNRRRATPDHRFKSGEEMRALFADLPEAIDNTLAIARRCAYMPERRDPILPAFPASGEGGEAEELRRQAEAGLDARLAKHVFTPEMDAAARDEAARPYRERLAFEIDVIVKMGFPGYFLIVADFIQWARREGIPVGPGRGSGAGSVVAWALTITDLDPLRFGLLFERFLNPERISMPDFDIDFCQDRRDEVIRYVQAKYGHDRVAQIITFGKLQARAALRDVGRVLQMPYGQVDRLCKLVPNNPANPVTLAQAIEGEPELQNQRDSDETVARLLDIAEKLEGLYRHASTHAAGVVIGDRPLRELIPLYRERGSEAAITQFSMKYVELAGLVKFDFLGLKTLTVLARCNELLARRGIILDLSALPLDDKPTYEMLGRAEVTGVFQLESSGMRNVLRQTRPDRFEDIIALVALYRPGPMDNIPRYIACKHGQEMPDYLHPSLEGILKETFGVIIYQEQVMQIAQVLSGYTLGAADLLRRAMGKKIKSEMAAQRQNFVNGAIARNVEKARATLIFDQVDKFAGYGFNKSHAAAYAMVAYQTAYLKANYPVEFLAASMTLDMGNTDKLGIFRQELDRLRVKLLPPDINRSDTVFTVEMETDGTQAVRYALPAVRNVGQAAMAVLVAERDAHGPFRSLADLAERVDARVINKRQLESLVCAGAFDAIERNRARAFAAIEPMVRRASAATADRGSQQQGLFGAADAGMVAGLAVPDVSDWSDSERLRREFEAVGFYLSAHPLDVYVSSLERMGTIPYARLASHLAAGGPSRVKLVGSAIGRRERTSQKGSRYAFVQFSDTSGVYEVVMFAEALSAARDMLDSGAPLLLTAEARLEDDAVRIAVQGVRRLDEAISETPTALRVYLRDIEALRGLKSVIQRDSQGKGRIALVIPVSDEREVEIAIGGRYGLAPPTRAALKAVPGVLDVREV
jgi:DNA polymerase-3 subunit alpha